MRKTGVTLDLAAIVLFVGIGRASHAHGLTFAGMASTAWPFLVGVSLGHLALAVIRRSETSFKGGLVVWISTVVLGMVCRVISGQGIAVAFVAVALGFLGATMLGWRALVAAIRCWRPAGQAPDLVPSSGGRQRPSR
jgi:hypothetical protein